MTASALLPVGRDCDCGHPMIWRDGHQRCSVYGRHPTPQDMTIHWRNHNATHASLIQTVMDGAYGPRAQNAEHAFDNMVSTQKWPGRSVTCPEPDTAVRSDVMRDNTRPAPILPNFRGHC